MKKQILIIDDTKLVADSLGEVLMMENFDSVIAYDGQQGLEKFFEVSPDLILSDLLMPALGGLDITRIIRAGTVNNKVPIIILTADVSSESVKACTDAGVNMVIQKPFDLDMLIAVVHQALE